MKLYVAYFIPNFHLYLFAIYLSIYYSFKKQIHNIFQYKPDINNHFDSYFNCLNNNAISHTK